MKIRWRAGAVFLVASNAARITTDPYALATIHFPPLAEPADIMIHNSGSTGTLACGAYTEGITLGRRQECLCYLTHDIGARPAFQALRPEEVISNENVH